MPNEIIRPCTLHDYWKTEEPIEAYDIISFGFNWGNDSILSFETVWNGQISKDAYPELDLAELEEVQKWIDERYHSSDFESIDVKDKEFLQLKYYRKTAHLIDEALNAPVLATEEVLAGLPDDAKAMTDNEDNECIFPFIQKSHEGWWGCLTYSMRDECFVLEEPLSSTSRIKSNGCSKTAEYLRQFYTNGVRIKEGGVDE